MFRKLTALTFCLLALNATAQNSTPADSVNPLVGTSAEGNTYPGVGVPFGMTTWTPVTRSTEQKGTIPYYYDDGRITGFRGSHMLSGSAVQDYGSFQLIGGSGSVPAGAAQRSSAYSHAEEHSTPYRYNVKLTDLKAEAAMTGTRRCGLLSFRFQEAGPAWIAVENMARFGDGTLSVDAAHGEITGSNPVHRFYSGTGQPAGFSGYVVVQFDHPFTVGPTWSAAGGVTVAVPVTAARPTAFVPGGSAVTFQVKAGETVQARIGTSFVSVDEARRNLHAEIPDWNFRRVEAASKMAWNQQLRLIEIQAPQGDRRVFYTALYHALQQPRAVNDVSGTRPKFAGGSVVKGTGDYYDDFSAWDTFRALHPLFTILDPVRDGRMVQSLVLKGGEGGYLPIFPMWGSYTSAMVGDHLTAIIGDAYFKHIPGVDYAKAYPLMRKNAFTEAPTALYKDGQGRRALSDYLRLGYVPLENGVADAFHKKEQVSRTLEYAYDDFVLARMAKAMGHAADADELMKRAGNYRNVIDPSNGFARGRHSDGTWDSPFDAAKPYGYITEGIPFQYTFFVPQDVPGLIALEGGRSGFIAKLDELFARDLYNHGNEPSHAITYLYDYAGEAWKTQEQVAATREHWYQDRPDGLAGNDDAGQMSAWYILSALGFYPVTPGIPAYEIGTPLLPSATIHLPGGKAFSVRAAGVSRANKYIQSATLNGKPLNRFWISHSDIARGGTLTFRMGPQPNKSWPSDLSLPPQ